MNGLDYSEFFVHPVEAAQRYDVSYGTIRNWVSEFCRGQDDGQPPPFRAVVTWASLGRRTSCR